MNEHKCEFCEDPDKPTRLIELWCKEESDSPLWEAWLCEEHELEICKRLS